MKNGHYAQLAKLQRQFSCDDHEQNPETRLSSVGRISTGRLSTAKSSPAFFATPLPNIESPKLLSHPPSSFLRLLSLNYPEWNHGLLGSVSAIAFGAVQPVYALIIGGMISAFFAKKPPGNAGSNTYLCLDTFFAYLVVHHSESYSAL